MRIGINCLSIDSNYSGGINTYIFGLIDGFVEMGNEHQFNIFVSNKNAFLFDKYSQYENFDIIEIDLYNMNVFKKILGKLSNYSRSLKLFGIINNFLLNDITALMDQNSEIIYTPTTTLFSFNSTKINVVSMHDIQHFHYPEFFSNRELLFRKITFQLTADNVNFIQASSEFIKKDLLKHFQILSADQIVVIPEGVDISTFGQNKETDYIFNKYNVPRDFLFFPAQLWKHKNHITVLKALLKLKQEKNLEIPLVLSGAQYSATDELFNFIKSNQMNYVYYLGKVPFDDLLSLYKKSKFLITAVLYESSSLPILESAASGRPIIASKTPPNLEMSEILKLNLFDPLDDRYLADLLLKLWNDEKLIRYQIMHNNKNINYYSWNNTALKYIDLFEKIRG